MGNALPEVTLQDVPPDTASYAELARFALTFDGYAWAVTHERFWAIADAPDPQSVEELRTAIFAWQRATRWNEPNPLFEETEALERVRPLLALLRARLARKG